eukprot:jgi/Psemu1/310824/fgenesh1_kg.685_\
MPLPCPLGLRNTTPKRRFPGLPMVENPRVTDRRILPFSLATISCWLSSTILLVPLIQDTASYKSPLTSLVEDNLTLFFTTRNACLDPIPKGLAPTMVTSGKLEPERYE